jgi:hypothetical protein
MMAVMRTAAAHGALLSGVVFFAAGCAEDDARLASVRFDDGPDGVEVVDAVAVNEAFTISIFSHGGGCITQSVTETTSEARRIEVWPYVNDRSGDGDCTLELVFLDFSVGGVFPVEGDAEVIVHGMHERTDSLEEISVRRTVHVLPE